jgi:hypothetical protein
MSAAYIGILLLVVTCLASSAINVFLITRLSKCERERAGYHPIRPAPRKEASK